MKDTEAIASISLGDKTVRVGTLWFHTHNERESASFEYDKQWLEHPEKFALDPALQLTGGAYHAQTAKNFFGAFGDSVPDRWGRDLMDRAERVRAKREGTTPRRLFEKDYLLGVNDEVRQGALRFSIVGDEDVYVAPQSDAAISPLIELSTLLNDIERYLRDVDAAEAIQALVAPGGSLGGARPKVSVRDTDGSLAIAKFPANDGKVKVVAWEAVALALAEQAGIRVPLWRLEYVIGKPVLIVKRFDRVEQSRIPFLSAMSMLGASDKDEKRYCYLEIAEAITQYGATPDQDLEELWRRIIFSVMIANVDDHLRNHGFLYERHLGWRLSPAYDLNPTPSHVKSRDLTTSIDYDDGTTSIETALSVYKQFRLSTDQAKKVIEVVAQSVNKWREVAVRYGITSSECNEMASAFEY